MMSTRYVTRIAPTPSGFLHPGNLLNFRLIQVFKELTGAKIILRIDDVDSARVRDKYIEDVFRHLEWLKIDVDEGPSDTQDFKKNYSQQLKTSFYLSGLKVLQEKGAQLYQCRCSRKDIAKASSSGLYPGTCRELQLSSEVAPVTRIATESNQNVHEAMGDFVLWRRNGEPAYQLVSLMEDLNDKVNFIIRGEDLITSTLAQKFLKTYLCPNNGDIHFYHHELITSNGEKLSKSQKNSPVAKLYKDSKTLQDWESEWDLEGHKKRLSKYLATI